MELRTMRLSTTSDITGKKKGSASNDIFEKCRNFTRPSDLQAAGLYMYFEVFGEREGCGPGEVRMGKRKVLMFGSNDYLDLINHPKVKEAATTAIKKYGSGCSGSRLLNGTLDIHVKLEEELAAFVHKEAAIIFGTGFQANYATLSALTEKGDVMICDHNLHASLVEGALRSPARTMRFRHNDLDHFERCLENCPPEEKIFIVSEGVFSMEGDIADLPGIVKLAKPYGARVYVDEAHGIGVLGPTGAGAAEHLGVLDEVDIVMGTFSKSLASVGGFIAAERAVVDYLKHTARPFVFSASLPAASVAAVAAALQIMKKEPERRLTCCASPPAARRAAAPRIQRAAGRDGHRAGGDREGTGSLPPLQGAAAKKASTSTRCCARPPRRTCCASPAPRRTPRSSTWTGWCERWCGSLRISASSCRTDHRFPWSVVCSRLR
jgi:8-amino-7-oxononanoate synthase